jgi:hypothetical protein
MQTFFMMLMVFIYDRTTLYMDDAIMTLYLNTNIYRTKLNKFLNTQERSLYERASSKKEGSADIPVPLLQLQAIDEL